MCPVAERLLDEEFLWFYHIAYPSTETDMVDIIGAVQKVVSSRALLAERADAISPSRGSRSQGRIEGRKGVEADI
jgi:hypothetical protein